jgi:hypothetical protein
VGGAAINNLDSKGSFSSHMKFFRGYPELSKEKSQPGQ